MHRSRKQRPANLAARTLRDCIVLLAVLAIGSTVQVSIDAPSADPAHPTVAAPRAAPANRARPEPVDVRTDRIAAAVEAALST